MNNLDLKKTIRKHLREGFAKYSKFERAMIIQDVLDRVGQYEDEYVNALKELNSQFPSTMYKRD